MSDLVKAEKLIARHKRLTHRRKVLSTALSKRLMTTDDERIALAYLMIEHHTALLHRIYHSTHSKVLRVEK